LEVLGQRANQVPPGYLPQLIALHRNTSQRAAFCGPFFIGPACAAALRLRDTNQARRWLAPRARPADALRVRAKGSQTWLARPQLKACFCRTIANSRKVTPYHQALARPQHIPDVGTRKLPAA
jgi:hypothetical protein